MISTWVKKTIKTLIDFWIASGRGLGRQKEAPVEIQRVETVRAKAVGRGKGKGLVTTYHRLHLHARGLAGLADLAAVLRSVVISPSG